jgi:hypothetical protein
MIVLHVVPWVVAVVGFVLYLAASKAEVKELGRALMWCGLLVALFQLGTLGTVVVR